MFKTFKHLVQAQLKRMLEMGAQLFVTDVEKDVIYDTYLNAYQTSETKQEHTCTACKQFVRPYANVVAINSNNELVSMWDIESDNTEYNAVAAQLSALVKSATIRDVFVTKEQRMGIDQNRQQLEDGTVKTWQHFFYELPKDRVYKGSDSVESEMGNKRASKEVFKRSLTELSMEAIDTVLELIESNSLPNGDRFKGMVQEFRKQKKAYDALPEAQKDNYCWKNFGIVGESVARIRNTSMGTLLIDLSEGKELEVALRAWDSMMAPTNYKRPETPATKKQQEEAKKVFEDEGLMPSLPRRFTVATDISIADVLWANRNVKMKDNMDIFEQLAATSAMSPKDIGKVEEIAIEKFITDVLPNLQRLEIMPENKHLGNLMSLTTAQDQTAPCLLSWGNHTAWTYRGNVTDAIKERVKAAGGKVDGVVRVSLSWSNYDDLDLHVVEPNDAEISFRKRMSSTGGNLDVDMNAGRGESREPVENITWPNANRMQEGVYKVFVENYCDRDTTDEGFTVEIECNGTQFHFSFDRNGGSHHNTQVCTFKWTRENGVEIITGNIGSSTTKQQECWGIKTQTWQEVQLVSLSPNFWNDKTVGTKHHMFFIKDCVNPDNPSGFFNEYLSNDMRKHRKTIEMLTTLMRCPDEPNQLSGLGFNSTVRNSVVVRATSKNVARNLKINF